jgi:cell division protein FtsN
VAAGTVAVALTLAAACGPSYRDRPGGGRSGPVVVGTVTPEGRVEADTLPGAAPDTAPVERETVVTGAIAPDPRARGEELPAADGAAGGPWVVQVFASRDQATADEVARGVAREAGAPARAVRDGGWYKVRAGGYADRAAAEALRDRLLAQWSDAFVLRSP